MKNGVRRLAVVMTVLLFALSFTVGTYASDVNAGAKKTVKAKSITLSKKSATVKKGKTLKLKATIKPKNATQKKITWSSSSKKVASVSSKGVVKGVKAGTAVITAKVKGTKLKASCKITVIVPVSKITLSGDSEVTVGNTTTLKATVKPKNASNKKVTWSSSDTSVATVDAKGKVTAVAPGQVTITATAKDGSKKTAKKVITVKNIEVTKIDFDVTEKNLFSGESFTITAIPYPEEAEDKVITWSSSDEEIAKVDGGVVTAGSKAGTATITAKANNGIANSCLVTVENTITVTNQQELNTALTSVKMGTIIIKSDDKADIAIPQGDYSDVSLAVDGKALNITNSGKFKDITITENSDGTFTENASGNKIETSSEKTNITISEDAVVSEIKTTATAKETVIVEDGKLTSLAADGTGTVNISGQSEGTDPIETTVTGEAKIITNKPLNLDTQDKITLILRPGAEDTSISVPTESVIPEMQGTGTVAVHVEDTGKEIEKQTEKLDEEYLEKLTFTGNVSEVSSKAAIEGKAYLAEYADGMNIETIDTLENTVSVDVKEGAYSLENILEGSYVFMIKADGYKPFIQMIVITARYGTTYTNDLAEMVGTDGDGKNAKLYGTIKNSTDKSPVQGLTVQIRKYTNTKTTEVVKETITNAEGYYEFENLEGNNYTVMVVDNRLNEDVKYITNTFNICINNGEYMEKGTAVTEEMSDDKIRFVLTWGAQEEGVAPDLDSHIIGSDLSGENYYEVFYNSKAYAADGFYKTILDVDETSYNGPETTTIMDVIGGKYYYFIHKYSYDGDLYTSHAQVDVYRGNKLIDSFVPKKNCQGHDYWNVCIYDSDEEKIIPVNKGVDSTTDIVDKTYENTVYRMIDTPIESISCDESVGRVSGVNDWLGMSLECEKYPTLQDFLDSETKLNITLTDGTTVEDYDIALKGSDLYKEYAQTMYDSYSNRRSDAVVWFEYQERTVICQLMFENYDNYLTFNVYDGTGESYYGYNKNGTQISISGAYDKLSTMLNDKFTLELKKDETKYTTYKIGYREKGDELYKQFGNGTSDAVILFPEYSNYFVFQVNYTCTFDTGYRTYYLKVYDDELGVYNTYLNGLRGISTNFADELKKNNVKVTYDSQEYSYEVIDKTSEEWDIAYERVKEVYNIENTTNFIKVFYEKYNAYDYIPVAYSAEVERIEFLGGDGDVDIDVEMDGDSLNVTSKFKDFKQLHDRSYYENLVTQTSSYSNSVIGYNTEDDEIYAKYGNGTSDAVLVFNSYSSTAIYQVTYKCNFNVDEEKFVIYIWPDDHEVNLGEWVEYSSERDTFEDVVDAGYVRVNYEYANYSDFTVINPESEEWSKAVSYKGVEDATNFVKFTIPKYGHVIYIPIKYTQEIQPED